MIADVQTLNKLDPNNKFCIYRTEKERLYISERVSDSDVEHEGSEDKDAYGYNMFLVNMEGVADKEYRCGKNIFTVTPKCDMSVSVCGNAKKVVYEGTEDNEHIWLIAVLTNAPTA